MATHADLVSVTITLDVVRAAETGFFVLLLVPLATNSLNSASFVTYTNTKQVTDDLASSYISATTSDHVSSIFAQQQGRVPTKVYVKSVDLVGGDTYATAFTEATGEDIDFYAVVPQSRTASDIAALGAVVESAGPYIMVAQSADSDWLTTGGIPSGFSSIDGNERSVILYHDADSEPGAECYAANRLARGPAVESAPWNAPIYQVAAYTTALTQAQADFADTNNANNGQAFGTATFYVDPGRNLAGRAIKQLVSADWLQLSIEADIAALFIELHGQGIPIPVSTTGQGQIEAIVRARYEQGVSVGHFEPDQLSVTRPAITSADLTAQRVRLEGSIQTLTGARVVDLDLNLSASAVFS